MRKIGVTTEKMWSLYQTGLSAAEVAREVRVSVPTVKQRFRRAGLRMRPPTERTDRWYENVAKAKTRNRTWAPSALEDRFFATLQSWNLNPTRNHPVGRYAIDFAWVEKKIGLEVDSLRHRQTCQHDQLRDEFLRSCGWTVVRVEVINPRCTGRVLLRKALLTAGLIDVHVTKTHRTVVTPR